LLTYCKIFRQENIIQCSRKWHRQFHFAGQGRKNLCNLIKVTDLTAVKFSDKTKKTAAAQRVLPQKGTSNHG
jgi:hypothetical protein